MAVISFCIAAAVVLGPFLWPQGIIVKAEEKWLNGTLTYYERVSGLNAVRHWWKGNLLRGGIIDGVNFDAPGGAEVVDRDGPTHIVIGSHSCGE